MEIELLLLLSDIINVSRGNRGQNEWRWVWTSVHELSEPNSRIKNRQSLTNSVFIVPKCSLDDWEIPKSSVCNLLLNNYELIFKLCLLLLKFRTLLIAKQVCLTYFFFVIIQLLVIILFCVTDFIIYSISEWSIFVLRHSSLFVQPEIVMPSLYAIFNGRCNPRL